MQDIPQKTITAVRIYQPTKTAMQSGDAGTKQWVVEPVPEDGRFVEPLMGWTGSTDMTQEVRLHFASKEEAVAYAERSGYAYEVIAPQQRRVLPKSYAENFQ